MKSETEPLLISALQHYSYCPRQCALIHQEQIFDDNEFTMRGNRAHRRVDAGESTLEDGICVIRSLPLYSDKYHLVGKADVVEFDDYGMPFPIEYKHGSRQKKEHDEIQLAAQALCLEEMTGKPVLNGAIYHHKSRRRRDVEITSQLKEQVIEIAGEIQLMLASGKLPPPIGDRSLCRACSLRESCQPELVGATQRLRSLRSHLFSVDGEPT